MAIILILTIFLVNKLNTECDFIFLACLDASKSVEEHIPKEKIFLKKYYKKLLEKNGKETFLADISYYDVKSYHTGNQLSKDKKEVRKRINSIPTVGKEGKTHSYCIEKQLLYLKNLKKKNVKKLLLVITDNFNDTFPTKLTESLKEYNYYIHAATFGDKIYKNTIFGNNDNTIDIDEENTFDSKIEKTLNEICPEREDCKNKENVPSLLNSAKTFLNKCIETKKGKTCEPSCNVNYKLEGQFLCKGKDSWESNAKCIRIVCPTSLQSEVNNKLGVDINSLNKCANTKSGEGCDFQCLKGFRKSGAIQCTDNRMLNQNNNLINPYAKWEISENLCLSVSCDSRPKILNAKVCSLTLCEKKKNNEFCQVVCDDGHFLEGTLKCEKSKWNDENVKCIRGCANSPYVRYPNGERKMEKCRNTKAGKECPFHCANPLVTTGSIVCDEQTSTWKRIGNPACSKGCINPPVFIKNGDNESFKKCNNNEIGTLCPFRCLENYVPVGRIICESRVGWVNESPSCVPGCQSSPVDIPFANESSLKECANSFENSICDFSCLDGYKKSGNLLCNASSGWINNSALCQRICINAPEIYGAGITSLKVCKGKTEGETCEVTCQKNTYYFGKQPICLPSGIWETENRLCMREKLGEAVPFTFKIALAVLFFAQLSSLMLGPFKEKEKSQVVYYDPSVQNLLL